MPPLREPLPTSDIRLAPDEVVVKTFPISGVTKDFGVLSGELTLTDARVIYHAHARNVLGESRTCRELQIAEVTGAALDTRRGLTPRGLLSTVFSLLVSLLLLALVQGWLLSLTPLTGPAPVTVAMVLFAVLFVVVTVPLIVIRAKSTEVVFTLFALSVDVSPIGLAGGLRRQDTGLVTVSTALVGRPLLAALEWLGVLGANDAGAAVDLAETQRMYDEIGSLILDIQQRGAAAGKD